MTNASAAFASTLTGTAGNGGVGEWGSGTGDEAGNAGHQQFYEFHLIASTVTVIIASFHKL